jgi:hypothetical protein
MTSYRHPQTNSFIQHIESASSKMSLLALTTNLPAISVEHSPSSDSPELILAHPTEKELQHIYNLTFSSWCDALTHLQYLEESNLLSTAPLAKNGGLRVWILTTSMMSPDERPILCSCETFKKRALYDAENGNREKGVEEKIIYGIASVFTNPVSRGKGYAPRMLRALSDILRQEEDCVGSILYSDIGPDYYAKLDWIPATRNTQFEIPAKDNVEPVEGELVTSERLKRLCTIDEKVIRAELANDEASGKKMAVIPDLQHMQWHHAKEEFVCQTLFGKVPHAKGAITGTPGERIWVIWMHRYYSDPGTVPNDNRLYVLRLVIEDLQAEGNRTHLENVLKMAQREASDWSLGKVVVWDPQPVVVSWLRDSSVEYRFVERKEDAIASLNWTGEGEVEWVRNEMYAWC